LQEASDRKKELERQHAEALAELRTRGDNSMVGRTISGEGKKPHETVEALQVTCFCIAFKRIYKPSECFRQTI